MILEVFRKMAQGRAKWCRVVQGGGQLEAKVLRSMHVIHSPPHLWVGVFESSGIQKETNDSKDIHYT